MFTGPRRPRGGSDARVTRPSAVHRFGEGQLSALTADRESRSDLGLFFGATFGFSWLMWALALAAGGRIDQTTPYVLFVVGAFGPTLVAAALWLAGRRRPRGRRPFRHVHRWLPAALLLGAAPALTAALLTGSFDLQAAGQQVSVLGGPLAVVGFALFTGPLSEEFGWRGYAQPRLRRTLSPYATSLVLGLAWGLWHLPLFLLAGTSQSELGLFSWQALLFFVGWVPVSYTIWTVSERLRGGVAAAVVAHAAVNTADGLFPAASPAGVLIGTAAATGTAIALAALNGRSHRRDATGVACSTAPSR